MIVDPIYVGVLSGANSGANVQLASTGTGVAAVVIGGSVLVVAGGLLAARRLRARER